VLVRVEPEDEEVVSNVRWSGLRTILGWVFRF
jgi:urease beta subunit